MKGKLIQGRYRILEILGHNTFSETFLAIGNNWFSHRCYIIKKFRPILGNSKAEDMRRLFYQEASLLKRLSGKNRQIPRLFEYFMDGEDFYIVRERIDGLTLKQKVEQQGRLSVREVEQILNSVLSFLKYIHSYGIVYRQLKPSTIILRQHSWWTLSSEDCLPVPIYFGGVKELKAKTDNSRQFSMAVAHQQEYIPPEQEQGKSVFASDLYSLGLTAIYLLTGKNPAELPLESQTRKLLWHQEVPELKIHLARIIDRAICPDTKERFSSAEEMLNSLHSPSINLLLPVTQEPAGKLRKFKFTSEAKIISLLSFAGIGVVSLTFIFLNIDFARFGQDDADRYTYTGDFQAEKLVPDTLITDAEPSPDRLSTETEIAKIPAFPLGMTQQNIIEFLGEPTLNTKGYWQNSRALLYQNILPEPIALGYLTDTETTYVRQAEITFGDSVDLKTIKLEAQRLLQSHYSPEIEHYINQVYFKTSDRYFFKLHNIEGVVQRNPPAHIYIAIWDHKFH